MSWDEFYQHHYHLPPRPERLPTTVGAMVGYVLLALGAVLWIAAFVGVLRDTRSSRATRIATAVVLVAVIPAGLTIWFGR